MNGQHNAKKMAYESKRVLIFLPIQVMDIHPCLQSQNKPRDDTSILCPQLRTRNLKRTSVRWFSIYKFVQIIARPQTVRSTRILISTVKFQSMTYNLLNYFAQEIASSMLLKRKTKSIFLVICIKMTDIYKLDSQSRELKQKFHRAMGDLQLFTTSERRDLI